MTRLLQIPPTPAALAYRADSTPGLPKQGTSSHGATTRSDVIMARLFAMELNMRRTALVVVFSSVVALLLSTSLIGQETVDLGVVHRIRQEALQNSQVMETLFYLTDVN